MTKSGTRRLPRLQGWLQRQLLQMLRENWTPGRSGLGFALGAFIGVVPSFAIGSPLAFLLAGRLGWNKAAAVAGTFLMNPFTAPLFYSFSTKLGLDILGRDLEMTQVEGLIDYLARFGLAFLVGNALVGLIFAIIMGIGIFLALRLWGQVGLQRFLESQHSLPQTPHDETPSPALTPAVEGF